jgi:HEPN domain-containing protein
VSLRAYAEALLREAAIRLESAHVFLERSAYAYVVRQCLESVELALKAALRLVGVEYPKEHEVSDVLLDQSTAFPQPFRRSLRRMAEVSRTLYASRIPSMYGEESVSKGPGELFSRADATDAVEKAEFVLQQVSSLFEELSQ